MATLGCSDRRGCGGKPAGGARDGACKMVKRFLSSNDKYGRDDEASALRIRRESSRLLALESAR